MSFMVMHSYFIRRISMLLHWPVFFFCLVICMQNEFLIANANVHDFRLIKRKRRRRNKRPISMPFHEHIRFCVATFLNRFCCYILYYLGWSEESEVNRKIATSHHSLDQFILILFHIIPSWQKCCQSTVEIETYFYDFDSLDHHFLHNCSIN